MDTCEYCNADDVTLYAWHADTWCARCIARYPHMPMIGTLEDAPLGRPEHPNYAEPFVWQTPDRSVVGGVQQ